MAREYSLEQDTPLFQLERIIEAKLHTASIEQSLVLTDPRQTPLKSSGLQQRREREFRANRQAGEQVRQKVDEIKRLAESVLQNSEIGATPDDKFLEDIADLSIDYFKKHWHELVDDAHTQQHQADWKQHLQTRLEQIKASFRERTRNK